MVGPKLRPALIETWSTLPFVTDFSKSGVTVGPAIIIVVYNYTLVTLTWLAVKLCVSIYRYT